MSLPPHFPPPRPTCPKCRPLKENPASTSTAVSSASHTTKRHYIGPIPVQPSHAKTIALAIADDTLLQTTTSNPEAQTLSNDDAEDVSWDHIDWNSEKPINDQPPEPDVRGTAWTNSFLTTASPDPISPPINKSTNVRPRPRQVHREPSAASVMSNASFVSAKPFFESSSADEKSASLPLDNPSTSASPRQQRFGRLSKQRNKSFPANPTLQPPSILNNSTTSNKSSSPATLSVPPRSIANVRSAENLRSNVSFQQSLGTSQSPRSPLSGTTAPLSLLTVPPKTVGGGLAPSSPRSDGSGHANTDLARLRKVKSADSTFIPRSETSHAQTLQSDPAVPSSGELGQRDGSGTSQPEQPSTAMSLRPKTSFANILSPGSSPEKARSPGLLSPARNMNRSLSPHTVSAEADETSPRQSRIRPDILTERSRSRLFPSKMGRGLPSKGNLSFAGSSTRQGSYAGIHLPISIEHSRDVSRQSRMSRASTVGTFNTIGTVVSEGSFGATTGAAQRLSRRIFTGSGNRRKSSRKTSATAKSRGLRTKLTLVRSNSVARTYDMPTPSTTHTRHASSPFAVRRRQATSSDATPRHVSMTTEAAAEASEYTTSKPREFKGVLPGAVGTSGGGTKWVGQSFEVGKRFYDVVDARRIELQKIQPCSCSVDADDAADKPPVLDIDTSQKAKKSQDRAVEIEHMKQSPDGVIALLAQEAQGASDDKVTKLPTAGKRWPTTASSLDASFSRKDMQSDRTRKTSGKVSSNPLTVSPPQPAPIEARQGWDDIVSRMPDITVKRPSTLSATPASTVYQSAQSSMQGNASNADAEQPITPRELTIHSSVPNPKILARSSSLLESETSSTDSPPVSSSQRPLPNGFAQRASSLAQSSSANPTSFDASSHPAPPSIVEETDPHLVHALLRRKSDIGTRPDLVSDVASDHAIAVKSVSTPIGETPIAGRSWESSPGDTVLEEQDPVSLDKTPADELVPPRHSLWKSSLLKPTFTGSGPQRKKQVKFENGPSNKPLSGRLTASLFTGKADDVTQPMQPGPNGALPGDTLPRPPEEVLARPQPHSLQTPIETDGADRSGNEIGDLAMITRKTVLKKDRMLVKLAWTPHEDLPKDFDELQARKYTIRDENWREFIVVFRMGKLEMWGDATLTNKIVGHGDRLKLRYTIPLSRGSTFVSLFSPIDRIFAITYQPWKVASSKGGIHLRRHGTEIVLFDCRARSAAVDWMWELWRELGGLIPESLELHVPSFGLKIKIPIPDEMPIQPVRAVDAASSQAMESNSKLLALSSIGQSQDGGEGFKLINRSNIIAMAWKLFQGIPEWRELIESSRKKGVRLELAWRRGTELDWVCNERTVDNEPRHWAVLCGSLLRDYKLPSMLELRVAAHYPTSVLIAPGRYMQEPPAVEGYLWRLKPVSGALTRLYLTTYDSHLYICRASRAFQPDRHLAFQLKEVIDMRVPRTSGSRPAKVPEEIQPVVKTSSLARALAKFVGKEKAVRRDEDMSVLRQNVLEAISYPAETDEEMQAQIDAYQSFERRRQFEQIRNSDGFIDLKLIYMIKTIGSGPVRCPGMDDIRKPCKQQRSLRKLQGDAMAAQREDEESDTEDDSNVANDIGGVEGLNGADDSDDLRKSRQVELTLTNGKSFRLEAFSASVAREWVEKISELVRYWRRRERADATELMYASGVDLTELNKHLQGRGTKKTNTVEVADEERLSPILGNIWNWCAIEGCRNIVRSGRLFHKKTKYGAFKARDYVLIAGRLLCFKLVRSVRTTRSRQNNGIFHRRQDMVIHLRDAYVYSGKLSEDMLQNGRSDPAQAVSGLGGGGSNSGERHRIPRVFADGLFSTDEDEGCTFVIRYRPERANTPADPIVPTLPGATPMPSTLPTSAAPSAGKDKMRSGSTIPSLQDKTYKYIAMRARSKMERDLWVRCIAYEIERIVRDDVDRETKLKNAGNVDFKK